MSSTQPASTHSLTSRSKVVMSGAPSPAIIVLRIASNSGPCPTTSLDGDVRMLGHVVRRDLLNHGNFGRLVCPVAPPLDSHLLVLRQRHRWNRQRDD